MHGSTTPYVKIEQHRDGGFGDLQHADIEMASTTREVETTCLLYTSPSPRD